MSSRSLPYTIFFLLLSAAGLRSQEQTIISGSIRSSQNSPGKGQKSSGGRQASIPGASVYLKGSISGTTTDSSGHYTFTTDARGSQVLVVSSVGFGEQEKQVIINDSVMVVDIVLSQDEKAMEPVVISAGSFIASDRARGASLTPMDVVTTAGNNGDIANALRALPGTQQIGEQEGLFVRGGTSDETKQFIDGTLFRNPNFSSVPGILQPARVSPFLFNGIVFSSGGYSALYGDAMSGALILESVDLPDKSSAIVGLSPIVGVAGFQELDKSHRYSYGVNSRYVDYNPYSKVIRQQPDYFHGPEFLSGDANFRIRTGNAGMLKFYVTGGYNNTGLRRPDIDSSLLKSGFQLKGANIYNNLSYRGQLGNDWKIALGMTYTYNRDHVSRSLLNAQNQQLFLPDEPYSIKNSLTVVESNFSEAKMVLTRPIAGGHVLRFGGGSTISKDRYSYNDTISVLKEHLTSAFAEADIRVTRHLAARTGLRYEYSGLLHQSILAPRISIGYRIPGIGQFNAAYGVFYQAPENQYIHQSRGMDFSYAVHYMLNYLKSANNRTFRVEAYYKQYKKLARLSDDSLYTNTGDGYARGIEVFWRDKKTFKGLDYWFTYTYIDTKRDYLNFPHPLHPGFATPHTASLVAKRFFEKINTSVNAAYTFATGRPYYNIVSDRTGKSVLEDQGTTIAYNSVNLSISYLCTLFKHWKTKDFTIIAFGMNNVLGTDQVFGYQYGSNGLNKVPVTLPAPRTLFGGIFVNFGIDRRNENLDDNL
jgi:vitamin B12 transporter